VTGKPDLGINKEGKGWWNIGKMIGVKKERQKRKMTYKGGQRVSSSVACDPRGPRNGPRLEVIADLPPWKRIWV
jgi:hypothetical protein